MLYSYIAHIHTSTMRFTICIIEHIEHIYSFHSTHKYNHTAAISAQIQIHSHIFTFTQGGGRDFKSLERPGWDSNPCSQSLVTSALDHYATTTPQRRQSLKALNLERYFHGKCFVDLTTAKSCLLEQQSTEWLKLVDSKPK